MNKAVFAAAALAVCAGVVHAQTVELRIIERKAQSVVTGPADAQLDFAVQARCIGAPNLAMAAFSFNVVIVGEPESRGVLERGYITNVDHTPTSAIGVSNTVGQGGLAFQYSYFASLNAAFNGTLNASSGTFTNGPDQEIGLILGQTAGAAFLGTPGLDLDADGNLDTWGNGTGAIPPGRTQSPMPLAVMQQYFGAGGNWVDVYRFRYTTSVFTPRTLDVRLQAPSVETFTMGISTDGVWGPSVLERTAIPMASNLLIGVGAPVAGACCAASGQCSVVLPAACDGGFLGSATCAANACTTPSPGLGACCAGAACTLSHTNDCVGVFLGAPTCGPYVCYYASVTTVACCLPNGQCSVAFVSPNTCTGVSYFGISTCTPNPCPSPIASGACCRSSSGGCIPTLAGECNGIYQSGAPCFPSPCIGTQGACCDLATGQCALLTLAACTGYYNAVGSCSPNPCPAPLTAGACCASGLCTLTTPTACVGVFSGAPTCGVSTCQTNAACCDYSTGACAVIFSTACVGPLPGQPTCSPTPCPPPTSIGVQFRIVERTGRTLVTGPASAELNLAVQARIVGAAAGVGLASFGFDMRIVGEPESAGALARAVTSNLDHTYADYFSLSNTVGFGGLAYAYTALAATNANFNGLINTSGSGFTNGPDQEIGRIAGQSSGVTFLRTPGIDIDSDNTPDTWPGSGSGTTPVNQTRTRLASAAAPVYFGAANQWIDVYRFRYTVTALNNRTLTFHLNNPQADVFSQVFYNAVGSAWAPWTTHPASTATDLVVGVIDATPGACCDAAGACTLVLRASCTGTFLGASTCTPSPCVAPVPTGACCNLFTGECTVALSTACQGYFVGAPSCSPQPCPSILPATCCVGACCQNSSCTVVAATSCPASASASFKGLGTVCGPDPAPHPCCAANFNRINGVNVQDIYDFLTTWFTLDPLADFNASGSITTGDVLDFLREWQQGC